MKAVRSALSSLLRSVALVMVLSTALSTTLMISLPTPGPTAESGPNTNQTPEMTLEELIRGNERFASGRATHCWQGGEEVRRELLSSQAPHAVVLSCSDSRVPPELIFDQGLGSLFTIRVAGNILSSDTLASIEYAVLNLGTRLIVILGHESCGAVKAAVTTPRGKDAGSKSLNELIAGIQRNIGEISATNSVNSDHDPNLRLPAKRNVSAVASDLVTRSPIIRKAVASGKVRVVEGIYSLDTEYVEFWD